MCLEKLLIIPDIGRFLIYEGENGKGQTFKLDFRVNEKITDPKGIEIMGIAAIYAPSITDISGINAGKKKLLRDKIKGYVNLLSG